MRLLTLAAFLLATSALAQTAAADSTDLSRGTNLPPSAAAWADGSIALVHNPAGLSRTGVFELTYAHERSNARHLDADGVYLSGGPGGLVGMGLSFDWLRPAGDPSLARARTSYGIGVGNDVFGVGTSINWFFGATAGLISLDVGLQLRPLRWLAVGAALRNLNQPVNANGTLYRSYAVSLGLRPFAERVSVGVDWVASESQALSLSRLQYTVSGEVIKGLRLHAGVSHGFTAATPLIIQAGLTVDFEHFGYTQGVTFVGSTANWQFVARASTDNYRSIVPEKKLAVVSLGELGGESTGSTLGSLLGVVAEDRFLKLLRFLDEASRDPELAGVVLKVEGASVGLARADELRSAVLALRAAGKPVYAYLLTAGDPEYLVASACDRIYAAPEAMVLLDGLRSSVTFLGGAAQKLGVDIDVARVGKYKNSPDQLTRTDMSDEQREALNAYLDTSQRTYEQRIAESRKISPQAWRAAVDQGLKSLQEEKALGHLDDVLTPAAFDEALRALLPGVRLARGYRPNDEETTRWGPRTKIAIVPVLGTIAGGRNQSTPLLGNTAGADSFIESINAAAEDSSVAAIVVRVDSGGGDAMASDLMYRAVVEAKKKKPVVTSMGDVAASGGYYVAMGADEVFASPTTLTGSIGVFFLKPGLKRFANSWGVTQESLSRGKLSGLTDLFDPWTDEQRAVAQRWVESSYDTFLTEVAASRNLKKEAVHEVAQGRVWSGEDAKGKGLVDKLGGLMDAIASAKERAKTGDDVELVVLRGGGGLLSGLLGATAPAILETPIQSQLPPGLEALTRQLGPAAWMLEAPRVQARLEYSLELR